MKKVILYNSDDYSPILNEELAQEIRQQYIKDNPHKKMTLKELDDVVAENLDSLEYEQYNEVIDRIHKGLDGVSLLISTDNHTNRSLDIWQNLDFKDVMETLMDSHHPSTINNVTIGIDETGTLFVDISSGNALTPTRAKVKNLTPLASKILDSFESNLDARDEENYEAFKNSEPLENARQRRKEFFDKAKIIVDALVEAEVFVFDDNGKIAYAEGQSADNLKDIYKNTSFYAGIFCNDVISKLPKEQLNDENPNKVRKQQ